MEHETFFTLITSAAHWELELFIMIVVDGIIGALVWPRIKRFFVHHRSDDNKIEALEQKLKYIEEKLEHECLTHSPAFRNHNCKEIK